jgi:hypothetical protein
MTEDLNHSGYGIAVTQDSQSKMSQHNYRDGNDVNYAPNTPPLLPRSDESDDENDERDESSDHHPQEEDIDWIVPARDPQVDYDSFLMSVESKLRAAFSSLDLAKVVATPALRGTTTTTSGADGAISEVQYLQRLAHVFSQTDKITQNRILIGLLGISPSTSSAAVVAPSDEMDDEFTGHEALHDQRPSSSEEVTTDMVIRRILEQVHDNTGNSYHQSAAPSASFKYEEWVQVIAGIVQGLLFVRPSEEGTGDNIGGDDQETREAGVPDTGSDALGRLDKTCAEILTKVKRAASQAMRQQNHQQQRNGDDEPAAPLPFETDPVLVPFRYALISKEMRTRLLPGTSDNPHFRVANRHGDLLTMDAREEASKVAEEYEHANRMKSTTAALKTGTAGSASIESNAATTAGTMAEPSTAIRQAILPGRGTAPQPSASGAAKIAAARKAQISASKMSSMFMPRSKPAAATLHSSSAGGAKPLAGRGGGTNPLVRTGLQVRKAGAAQALVNRQKVAAAAAVAASTATSKGSSLISGRTGIAFGRSAAPTATVRGGASSSASHASAAASGRSKMTMLDVDEVQELTQKQKEREGALHDTKETRGRKKRKVDSLAHSSAIGTGAAPSSPDVDQLDNGGDGSPTEMTNHQSSPANNSEDEHATSNKKPKTLSRDTSNSSANALASAALSAYQARLQADNVGADGVVAAADTANNNHAPTKQLGWQELLAEKSNRLKDEDRERIQQFFEHKYNPTPEQSTYKMKIHEERKVDPATGLPVKYTYYLELDYTNFTSLQSKRKKEYKDE